jgi:hypothetical protein
MTNQGPIPPDERRRPEPEIIPPGRPDRSGGERDSGSWSRVVIDQGGMRRIYVSKIGPLGLIPFALLAALISIALLIFFVGAFLILLPVIGLFVAGAVIAGLMGAFSRRSP